MKKTGVCPKCQHNQLLHVTQVADRIGKIGGTSVDWGTEQGPQEGRFFPSRIARMRNPNEGIFSYGVMAAGLVEAFICRSCGLTELYTRDPDSIEADGELVREISGPKRQTPFR